jgi:hypothetical protein
MVFDHRDEYASQYDAIRSIAAKIGWSSTAASSHGGLHRRAA